MSKQKQQRGVLRNIHLIISIALGVFIYSPLRNNAIMLILMRFGVFPTVTLTGLWMWLGPKLNKSLKRQQSKQKLRTIVQKTGR